MPKLTRLTHPTPCPCSNRVAGGHHGLKSTIKCPCHVNLFHLYLGGPFATSMTLGDSLRSKEPDTLFFYKQPLFLAEPGKEIEITTSKLTTMCLKNQQFQPMCAYKLRAYKKNKVYSVSE